MEISANKFLESACKYYDNIAVNEFKLLTNEIGNNTGKYIIFDFTKHKPKYGEIIMAIQTAIFIKKLGFDTQIVAFLALNRGNLIHKKIWMHDKTMQDVVKDLKKIFEMFLTPHGIKWEILFDKVAQEKIINSKEFQSKVLFGNANKLVFNTKSREEYIRTDYNFFRSNQELLSMIVAGYIHEPTHELKEYFIGDFLKIQSSSDKYSSLRDTLVTNFRYTPGRPAKNGDPKQILELAKRLYEYFGKKTLITTSGEGRKLMKEVSNGKDYPILFSNPGDFIEESKSAVNCKLLYLHQGGGISTWYVLSKKMPFFLLAASNPLLYYEKFRLLAHHDIISQVYRNPTPNKINNFYVDLKNYLEIILKNK